MNTKVELECQYAACFCHDVKIPSTGEDPESEDVYRGYESRS